MECLLSHIDGCFLYKADEINLFKVLITMKNMLLVDALYAKVSSTAPKTSLDEIPSDSLPVISYSQ